MKPKAASSKRLHTVFAQYVCECVAVCVSVCVLLLKSASFRVLSVIELANFWATFGNMGVSCAQAGDI